MRKRYFCERDIQELWAQQKYFKNLISNEGKCIHVVSSGIWNLNEGPDFTKAHIVVDGVDLFGDVEIHVEERCWMSHKHNIDPRYNNVILHVVFFRSVNEGKVKKENRSSMLTTFLEDNLLEPIDDILNSVAGKKILGVYSKDCCLFVAKDDEFLRCIRKAAFARMYSKLLTIKNSGFQQSLLPMIGIGSSLGLRNNVDSFSKIFVKIFEERGNFSFYESVARSLGMSYFFSRKCGEKWGNSGLYRYLQSLWEKNSCEERFPVVLNNTRPLNHPVRRLVALVMLAFDDTNRYTIDKIKIIWNMSSGVDRIKSALYKFLPIYNDNFWNYHYTFTKETGTFISLIGKEMQNLTLINGILPIMLSFVSSEDEKDKFLTLCSNFPALKANRFRHLIGRLRGGSSSNFLRSAAIEQGLYKIYEDFCKHYPASCECCPIKNEIL